VCRERANLTIVDVPGFGLDRLSTALFLAVAIPSGLMRGRRTSVFVGMKLASPAIAAALCGLLTRRPFLALATTSGPQAEVVHLTAARRGVGGTARRALLGRARFLVGQHATAARQLSALVPPERVAVVPTPVVALAAPPLTGEPHVVFTGRLSRDKDLVGLLEAWSTVVSRRPESRLTLVGAAGRHEPFEQELHQVVAGDPALRASVDFTGWVDDVAPLLASADVFVLPSLEEGMSNALLEACACGRVVVATDIPGNRAVLGDDYPLLFAPGDGAALADLLLLALSDGRLRSAAQAKVSERAAHFSVESVVDRLEALLIAAAGPTAHRSPLGSPPPRSSDA
jgi:glycosyltransferase involved in cell wall biosynthesis